MKPRIRSWWTSNRSSAPAKDLYAHFGVTAERVADEVRRLLGLPGAPGLQAATAG